MTKYISLKDTSKTIKKELKEAFPTVKFSVRSETYAGGSSIHISYDDGPTTKDVEAITKKYQSTSFDGMIDMTYYITQWVKDGKVIATKTTGTQDSMGVVPPRNIEPPCEGCKEYSFDSGYVSVHRHISKDIQIKLAQFLFDNFEIKNNKKPETEEDMNESVLYGSENCCWWQFTYRFLYKIDLTHFINTSKFILDEDEVTFI
jgi:hypothetical protein